MKRREISIAAAIMTLTSIMAVAPGSARAVPGEIDPPGSGRTDLDQLSEVAGRPLEMKLPVKIDPTSPEQTYLIRFVDPAVPTYRGGIDGIPATQPDRGVQLDSDAPEVRRYADYLRGEQTAFLGRAAERLGRRVRPVFQYEHAINGMAVRLTGAEALEVAKDPSVVSVMPDARRELHTDEGPDFIGADELWDGSENDLPADYQGEGMVIGVIDTGISPNNPSFADVVADNPATAGVDESYDHPTIRSGERYGICDSDVTQGELIAFDADFPCNDKLIGAYVYDVGAGLPPGQSWDYDSHGSHTTSTAGGNYVHDVVVQGTPFDISGVAPRAHLISYLGCCSVSALTASIDQAIEDEVDAINYSIGSSAPSSGWDEFDVLGFLNAREAGIFVATSNGNDGPGLYTGGSPADAPWVTSVANQTHTRYNGNRLVGMAGGGTPPADILGKGITGPLPSTPIIYAGDYGDPMCVHLAPGQDAPPEGEGDPAGDVVQAHPEFEGRIVVCDRGANGRVQKSRNVAAHGAAGFVLANDVANGDSLTGDEFAVPGVAIGYEAGVAVKTWLDSGTGHVAAIAGFAFEFGDQYADFISASSSRGPNRFVDVLNPSVSAPGTDILAATVDHEDDDYGGTSFGFISGTSMASPHVAGAGALIMQAHPTWTPAQIQSALMTTASPTVQHHNGGDGDSDTGVSTPDVQGSGRVRVGSAANAALLFDETAADYLAANPDEGGDPKSLNLPSFMDSQCLVECTWTRTATVPSDPGGDVPANVTWTPSYEADAGLMLDVQLSDADLSPGDSTAITVTADVDGAEEGVNLYGRITLTPSDADVPAVTMPVLVVPSSAVVPDALEVETRRDTGSEVIEDVRSEEVTDLTGTVAWVAGDPTEATQVEDPTNTSAYDDLSQVDVFNFEVLPGTASAVFEVVAAEMPDLDLFVGTGTTPGEATEVCAAATATALESCQLTDPEPGDYWVVIQNWEGTTPTAEDAYTLMTAFVPGAGNGTGVVEIPAGTIPTGEPYDVTYSWDLPGLVEGDVRYGAVVLGAAPGAAEHIATVPVTLFRLADDVVKTAYVDGRAVDEVLTGETVEYEITVEPNVRDHDLAYTITDTIPPGMTLVDGSVTGELDGEPIPGTVAGDTITWDVTMPSPSLGEFSYVASTPADNPACAAVAGYVDIGSIIPLEDDIDEDTSYIAYSPGVGPIPFYGEQISTFAIGEDGFIGALDGFDIDAEVYVPQEIPDTTLPNGVIAPLWTDLVPSLPDGAGVRIAEHAGLGAVIVEWDNLFDYEADPSTPIGTSQLWLYNAVDDVFPEMTFEYADLDSAALAALSQGGATVGVEDLLGENATAIVSVDDPFATLEEAGTICLDYAGPQYPPATLSYSVTVGNDVELGTVLTNEVTHVTDEPHDEAATTDASVTVVTRGLEADPTSLDFGDVRVGTTSAEQVVTFEASGTGEVFVDAVNLPAPFEVVGEDCTTAPVAAGATCEVTVAFAPTAAIQFQGDLTVSSDAPTSPAFVALTGSGVEPLVDVGSTVSFPDTMVGDSADHDIVVGNPGSAPLTVTSVSVPAPFTADAAACLAGPVPAGGACTIVAGFEPTMLGLATATLSITGDDSASPHTVSVMGIGLAPDLAVSPAEGAQFGEVLVGETASDVISLVNSGNAPLTIDSLDAGAPFTVVDETCTAAALAPDAGCQVTVEFAPAEGGAFTGALTVESDAVGAPHLVVLAGEGVEVAEAIVPVEPGRYWDTRDLPTLDNLYRNTGRMTGGTWHEVRIAGRGDVPADAAGVIANLAVIAPDGPGYATLYPCTATVPTASHVNYFAGEVLANNAIVPLSDDGAVCVYTSAGADFALDVNGFIDADAPQVGIAPARYLDTRTAADTTTFDGLSQGGGVEPAGTVVEVPIAGRGDVPADAVAAIVNVTAVTPEAAGYLTLYPCTDPPPTASTVNYLAGQVVPNGALVELSGSGSLCIYTLAATDIVLDVTGFSTADVGSVHPTSPARLLDTRPGEPTIDTAFAGDGRLGAGAVIEVQVAGRAGIPADASAAFFNVAAVLPDGPGFVTLFPCGDTVPETSNLNFAVGGIVRANNAATLLSEDGTVCAYTLVGTDLVLDVTGWID